MNKREYISEYREFLNVKKLLAKQYLEILQNTEPKLDESLSQDTITLMDLYETNLNKAISILKQINPPTEFKTVHELNLQQIQYFLEKLYYYREMLLALEEKNYNEIPKIKKLLDFVDNKETITHEREIYEFNKAAGIKSSLVTCLDDPNLEVSKALGDTLEKIGPKGQKAHEYDKINSLENEKKNDHEVLSLYDGSILQKGSEYDPISNLVNTSTLKPSKENHDDENKIINYHPENGKRTNVKFKSKRFFSLCCNVFVPNEWFEDDDPDNLNYKDSSNVNLRRYNPEVELYAGCYKLKGITEITNLDVYINDEKLYEVQEGEVLSEGYIDINGIKGYRIDWISPTPLFFGFEETKFREGTSIIVITNNRHYVLRFLSYANSVNESNLFDIRDDITFIINHFQTKNPDRPEDPNMVERINSVEAPGNQGDPSAAEPIIKTNVPKNIALNKFEFNYDLCFSNNFSVEIKDYKVILNSLDISDEQFPVKENIEYVVSEDNLINFWRRINQIDIFNWEEHYDANEDGYMVFDGYSWDLCIESNDKSIESFGDNKFPPSFRQFLDAIEELTNKKIDLVNRIKYLR